jgi:PEP-CTERM motif
MPTIPRAPRRYAIGALVAIAVLVAQAASAQTVEWSDTTGFWDVAANWLSGVVPGASNDVIIDVAGVQTVTVRTTGGPFSANSINMNGGDETLAISGSLTLVGDVTGDNPTGDSVITNLILAGSSAVLGGAGNLTVTGNATLGSDATMTGTGTTTLQGATTISGSSLSLDAGRVLQNEGTVSWSANTTIYLDKNTSNGGVGSIVNAVGAVWESTGNSVMVGQASGDGTPTFDNAGTFVKSGGTGDTYVGVQFNNTGTLDVQTGTVRLTGGSTHTGAELTSSGSGTIEFGNGVHTLDATTTLNATNVEFSSSGTTTIDGVFNVSGTTTLSGNHVTFLPGADLQSLGTTLAMSGSGQLNLDANDVSLINLNATGGTLSGTGTVTVTGSATLGGTMTGTGTTHLAGGVTSTLGSLGLDSGRVLLNEGTVSGSGNVNLNPSTSNGGVGTIVNAAGAVWDVTGNSSISGSFGGDGAVTPPTFVNEGTFQKSGGTGNTTVSVVFENTGTLDVQTGTVILSGGSTHTSATITGAGTIQFGARTHTLDAASELTAANVRFAGGSTGTTTVNGLYDVAGSTTVLSGLADLSAADLQSLGASLTVSGGTLNLGAHDPTVTSLTLGGSTGTITGTGTLTVTGTGTITGGTMTGAGTTVLMGTTTVSGTGVKNVDAGRSLLNEGTVLWTGGNFNLNPSTSNGGVGTIVNAVGATWDAEANNTISGSTSGDGAVTPPSFENLGTFVKSGGGTGTTTVSAQFNNAGTVEVQTGTIILSGGGTHTGAFDIAEGASLRLSTASATTHVLNAGTSLTGSGTVIIGAGVATSDTVVSNTAIDFAGTTNIYGLDYQTNLVLMDDWTTGSLLYQGGTIEGPGDLTVSGAATIEGFSIYNLRMAGAGTTTLQGETTMQGRIDMTVDSGRVFRNEGVLTWTSSTSTNVASGIDLLTGSTLVNAAGAEMHLVGTGNNSVSVFGDGSSSFDNFGTLTSNGPSGQANGITTTFNNAGTVIVETNRLVFSDLRGDAGTVIVDGGAWLDITSLGSAETGTLRMETGGQVILNSGLMTIHEDYDNANFGEGDAFNPLGNVSNVLVGETGMAAAGDVAQTITGAEVAGGTTATPTLTIGNVRVGGSTFTYDVNNTGTDGPVLRGAIQTGVNGANITDARLSGGGVTAGNFTPIELGSSDTFDVVFTVGTAGVLDPMAGQAVHVINNFGNVTNQLLTITVAEGSIAYRLAEAEITPQPIVLGNARVGMTSPETQLSITNTAIDDGFSEKLNASVSGTTSDVLASGSFTLLGPGATDSSAISVSMDTSVAGSRNGTVTIDLASDGTGTSGLAALALSSQTIDVSGAVFRLADGQVSPDPLVLNARVGDAASGALTIANIATADGYSESLDVTGVSTVGAAFGTAGSVAGLIAAGTSDDGVAVTLNTGTAGTFAGTATVTLESNGLGTSDIIGNVALGTESVALEANVFQAAVGEVTPTVDLGYVRVGSVAAGDITVANTAPVAALNDVLRETDRTVGGTGFMVTGGSGDLAAGADRTVVATLDTSAVGAFAGSATFEFASHNALMSDLDLGSQVTTLSGTVTQLANPIVQASLSFGNVQQGSLQEQAITVTNDVALSEQAFTDLLNATFDPTLAAGIASLTGGITGLAGGLSDGTSMVIQLDTSTAGAVSATATVLLVSDGTAFGFGETELPPQTVQVLGTVEIEGSVFRLAEATIDTPQPIALGNVREGDMSPTALLSITNSALADGFSESLNAAAGTTTGGLQATGSFTLLAAGGTNADAIAISMDTATAGSRDGTATLTFASDGTGTSGAGLTPLDSQDVQVTGSVFRLADGQVSPDPLVLNARVGDAASGALTIANIAAADGFSESLGVTGVSTTAGTPFGTSGAVAGLIAAGTSDDGVAVTLNTDTAGTFAGTATVTLESNGLGTSDIIGNVALGTETVSLNANVFQTAIADVTPTLDLGVIRVGDPSNTATIEVHNVAPTAVLNDVLRESGRTVGAGFVVDGDVGDVVAGGVSPLTVSLMNSLAAGDYSSEILLDLVSHNPLMTDVSAGTHSVLVEATVNNLAAPEFEWLGGDGSLSSLGPDQFLLDFGARSVGTGLLSLSADLGVRNAATGPADDLAGDFILPAGSLFDFSGFGSFLGLSAGSSFGNLGLGIDLDLTGLGPQLLFGQLFLNPVSMFPGLVDLPLSTVTLDFRLNLVEDQPTAPVPEPGTVLLLLSGLAGLGASRVRRRGRRPGAKA